MAWIESHHTLRNNPKIFSLCKELKIGRPEAIGHLHCLWWWAIEHRDNGDLGGLFEKDIAFACDWDGDAKKLVKALKKCRWITADMKLHDWLKYAGRLLNERAKYQRRKTQKDCNCTGEHTCNRTGDSPGIARNTEPNPTKPNLTVIGLFEKTQEKAIKKALATRLGYGLESQALEIAYQDLIKNIKKDKSIKDPMAVAMHRAQKGFEVS